MKTILLAIFLFSTTAMAELAAKVSCSSKTAASQALVYGGASQRLSSEFTFRMTEDQSLVLRRFTGQYEPPAPDCVGVGCVQPIYEGKVSIRLVEANTAAVFNQKREVIFSGEGLLDLTTLNGFVCHFDVTPFKN